MNDMEVIKRGEIKERGKGSMCIPLPAELAKLKGVGIGDVYELCLDKGKVIVRFPKEQGEKREIFD